jgi:hypothetical protein
MIPGVSKRGEHTIIAGHILRATAIKKPMFTAGFIVHLHAWEDQTLVLGTQPSFGPWTWVMRALGSQSCFGSFFLPFLVSLPMNLALMCPFTLLKRKWLFSYIVEFLGMVGKGMLDKEMLGKGHSQLWWLVT